MINIFKEAKSSIDPELAPVFVGCIQVIFYMEGRSKMTSRKWSLRISEVLEKFEKGETKC